jgi:hypothetical protein
VIAGISQNAPSSQKDGAFSRADGAFSRAIVSQIDLYMTPINLVVKSSKRHGTLYKWGHLVTISCSEFGSR